MRTTVAAVALMASVAAMFGFHERNAVEVDRAELAMIVGGEGGWSGARKCNQPLLPRTCQSCVVIAALIINGYVYGYSECAGPEGPADRLCVSAPPDWFCKSTRVDCWDCQVCQSQDDPPSGRCDECREAPAMFERSVSKCEEMLVVQPPPG